MGSEQNPYRAPASDRVEDAEKAHGTGPAPLATRGKRFLAALIDVILQTALSLPLPWMLGAYDGFPSAIKPLTVPETLAYGVWGMVVYLVLNGYLLATSGQTVGKRAVSIRIVSFENGRLLPFSRILTHRLLPAYVPQLVPLVGPLLTCLEVLFIFRKDRRCLHDLIAGTHVVRA